MCVNSYNSGRKKLLILNKNTYNDIIAWKKMTSASPTIDMP